MNEEKHLAAVKTHHLFLLLSLSFVAFAMGQSPPTQPAATPAPPPAAPPQRSAADLEKLVAPIALYPDPLIATILPASVYPLEIVQAARFVANTNNLANLDAQPWDENVKAVARVPSVIQKMNEELTWTMELGEAFLAQDKEVMDAIQSMRAKAQKAGTLQTAPQQVVVVTNLVVEKTVEQQVVVVTNTIVQIQPANPQVIYVPTYPPTVYYPPPAYVYNPYAPLVTFAAGVAVGAIIANNCDWHHGGCYHSDVNINVNNNYNRNVNASRNANINTARATASGQAISTGAQKKWQPDQSRLRTSGAPPSAQTREARGWGSAGTQPAQRPATGGAAARPSQLPSSGVGGARPAAQPSQRPAAGTQPARAPGAGQVASSPAQRPASSAGGARPTTSWQQPSAARPAQSPSVNRPSPQPSSAFSGVSSGSSAQSFSNRGASSRGGGGGRGGGGRGGGRR